MYIEVKDADFSAVKVGIYDDFNYSENYFANAVTAEEAERQATHIYYYTGAVYSSIIS